MTEPGGAWRVEVETPLERDTLFTRQANAFLDAIESESPPLCDLDSAWQTLRVNLAILRSAETGRWEVLNDKSPAEKTG